METCFSRVTKRPACIYQGDLTPQPACRLPDFPFPFISESSSIHRDSQGEPFFFFPQTQLGEILPKQSWENVWPVPQPFHTQKALWMKLPLIEIWLREYFIFSSFSSFPFPPIFSFYFWKKLTLARKRVGGFRGPLHLHKIKTNVITSVRGRSPFPQWSGEWRKGTIILFQSRITQGISENGNTAVRSNLLPLTPIRTFPLFTKLVFIAYSDRNSWEAFLKVIQLLNKL